MSETPHVSVDVGGTFTDVVLLTRQGLTTAKVPSTADQSVGVLSGIEKACGQADISPQSIQTFTHAMTVSVNALLERDGAETALVTTTGFRDVLEIGRQTRDELYDLSAERSDPLVPRHRRYELNERARVDGIETPVDLTEVDALAEELDGIESVAVSLLHAYSEPENEALAVGRLRDRLDVPVSASHEVLPTFREYERTSTTVVDAYVRPAIDAYLSRLSRRAETAGLPQPEIMQSNGGIAAAETVRERAVTTVLSGPTAGVVGAKTSATGVGAGRDRDGIVTFDMGGTSSDVSLVQDGHIARTTDAEIDGQPVAIPMVDIETVGSGGGSIAWIDDGGALRVGPQSAGADPGPVCYGRGGDQPTVTDASVVLGYIGEDTKLGGEVSLDADAADEALTRLAETADLGSAREAAEGVYQIANATMTRAIRSVTVERGHDPREFDLVAFGGAGPLHAAAIADRLEMDRVVVPLAGGVLSAYGLSAADEKHDTVRTHRTPLTDADPTELETVYTKLSSEVRDQSTGDDPQIERSAELRYAGQSFELEVPVTTPLDIQLIRDRFHETHERVNGYRMDDPIELVTVQVSAVTRNQSPPITYSGTTQSNYTSRAGHFNGENHQIPVFRRDELRVGTEIEGPGVFEDEESTVVVPPTWDGTVLEDGTVLLDRGEDQ